MKSGDAALLLAVGIGGFALWSGGFFKNLSKVGEGVGDAFGGVGAGIGDIGYSLGDNVSDVLDSAGGLLVGVGDTTTGAVNSLRQPLTDGGNVLQDVTGSVERLTAPLPGIAEGLGDALNYTWNLNEPTNIFSGIGSGIGKVFSWAKSNTSSASDWVTKQAKSLRTPSITGMAVAVDSPKKSIRSGSSNDKEKTFVSTITQQTPNAFLEKLGYQGQSTMEGIVYTQPKPTWPWS